MKKVYVIVSGDYSSYRVHLVFTTRALADAFVADRNASKNEWDDPYDVEEYDLWSEAPPADRIMFEETATVIDGQIEGREERVISIPFWEMPYEETEWVRLDKEITVRRRSRADATARIDEWVSEKGSGSV